MSPAWYSSRYSREDSPIRASAARSPTSSWRAPAGPKPGQGHLKPIWKVGMATSICRQVPEVQHPGSSGGP